MSMRRGCVLSAAFALLALHAALASADPLARPGDLLLRHDLALLSDAGIVNLPINAWPIPWGDIHAKLHAADPQYLDESLRAAFERLKEESRWALSTNEPLFRLTAAIAVEPRVIRSFENTPREDLEAGIGFSWLGDRFMVNLEAALVDDPVDGDEIRPDGTYVGAAVGNWILTAGWQDRWWGPGHDGSLVLSTNARPRPGITLSRNLSVPFETRWLSWIGPWTLSTFLEQLDDERAVNDALLWGLRVGFRPLPSLEIGLSRTAQWCGDERPCDLDTFYDVLIGNDNRGVNVDPDEEPGNQLAGIDIRWSLPKSVPAALYMQWIGEDSRQGGPEIGSWLRLAGAEAWGRIGGLSHRTHVEWAETICREGGFGFSDEVPNCAYVHPIYATGYRYISRSLGHGIGGDSESYSIGSTLVQSAGHTWNLALRFMDINTVGAADASHTLSPTPEERVDVQLSHDRITGHGRFRIGLGYSRIDGVSGTETTDVTGFLRWSSH